MTLNKFIVAVAAATCLGILTGCEWESADDFNTSQGAGTAINFSGMYRPKSGSYLVGSNISHLVLSQVGNSLEVRDSNNSYYQGTVGAPGVVSAADPTTGAYPTGATILQAQISFSGHNDVTGQDVDFVGIIHAVAVSDVRGVSTAVTTGGSSDRTSTLDIQDGEFSATSTTNSNSSATTTTTTDYTITEANTQMVLEGNWTEGSMAYTVGAIAPSAAGTFSTSTTTTDTTTE